MSYDGPGIPPVPETPTVDSTQSNSETSVRGLTPVDSRLQGRVQGLKGFLATFEVHHNIATSDLHLGIPRDQDEQLKILHKLLMTMSSDSDSVVISRIVEFAEKVVEQTSDELQVHSHVILGVLLFVIDRHFSEALENIDPDEMETSLHWMDHIFRNDLRALKENVDQVRTQQQKSDIQDSNDAYYSKLSAEMAKMLLNRNGEINIGIISYLKNHFEIDTVSPLGHELNIVNTLKKLMGSPFLRQKLAGITAPLSEFSPGNCITRLILNLAPGIPITDLHAKQAVLSALLCHLRQGKDSACYAASIAIQVQLSDMSQCINDLSFLIQFGCLTRTVNHVTKQFPLLLQMNDPDLSKPIHFDDSGKIVGESPLFLWEVPGIYAGCKMMRIEDVPSEILRYLSSRPGRQENILTARELFEGLVGLDPSRNQKFCGACIAFTSQVRNPLLTVWKNVIAGMAEADSNGMIISVILSTVRSVIQMKLAELCREDSSLVEEVIEKMTHILMQRITLQFDPGIGQNQMIRDGRSSEGAFVLYDRNQEHNPFERKRIDHPAAFRDFMLDVIGKLEEENDDHKLSDLFSQLNSYLKTDRFLIHILNEYESSNSTLSNPLRHPERIQFAPWITRCGNDLSRVLKSYLGSDHYTSPSPITPKNATDLLEHLISGQKESSVSLKREYTEHPHLLFPIRIPRVHAFSTMLGHPTFRSAWESDLEPRKWIEEHVVVPGKKIGHHRISSDQRKGMIAFCTQSLIQLPLKEAFLSRVKDIPDKISIHQFRKEALGILDSINPKSTKKKHRRMLLLDQELYKTLPKKYKDELHETAVHFADSNWFENGHDIHFCFIMNPGSKKIELWGISDDRTQLYPLDQFSWVRNKKWEFFQRRGLA